MVNHLSIAPRAGDRRRFPQQNPVREAAGIHENSDHFPRSGCQRTDSRLPPASITCLAFTGSNPFLPCIVCSKVFQDSSAAASSPFREFWSVRTAGFPPRIEQRDRHTCLEQRCSQRDTPLSHHQPTKSILASISAHRLPSFGHLAPDRLRQLSEPQRAALWFFGALRTQSKVTHKLLS